MPMPMLSASSSTRSSCSRSAEGCTGLVSPSGTYWYRNDERPCPARETTMQMFTLAVTSSSVGVMSWLVENTVPIKRFTAVYK